MTHPWLQHRGGASGFRGAVCGCAPGSGFEIGEKQSRPPRRHQSKVAACGVPSGLDAAPESWASVWTSVWEVSTGRLLRTVQDCASCHSVMFQVGYALGWAEFRSTESLPKHWRSGPGVRR